MTQAGLGEFSRVWVVNASEIVGGGSSTPSGTQSVNVQNFPATQAVTATQLPATLGQKSAANSLAVVLASDQPLWPATQPVSGTVSVGNFPATQPVSGSVSVSNFPTTQPISGTVAASQSGTWNVGLTGALPAGTNLIGAVTSRGTGSMATGQIAMSAGNTAYQVVAARAGRRSVTIVPTSQFTYFYGNSGVTTTTGAVAPNGAAITLETSAAVFVVSGSTGTMTFVEHF